MGVIFISFLLLISSLWITAVKEDEGDSFVYSKLNIGRQEGTYTCMVFRKGPHQKLNGPLMIIMNMNFTDDQVFLECMVKGFAPEDNNILTWMKNGKTIPEEYNGTTP